MAVTPRRALTLAARPLTLAEESAIKQLEQEFDAQFARLALADLKPNQTLSLAIDQAAPSERERLGLEERYLAAGWTSAVVTRHAGGMLLLRLTAVSF